MFPSFFTKIILKYLSIVKLLSNIIKLVQLDRQERFKNSFALT